MTESVPASLREAWLGVGFQVCKCEKVTEAEVIDACHRSLPVDSTQAMRKRVRAGMGHCQVPPSLSPPPLLAQAASVATLEPARCSEAILPAG